MTDNADHVELQEDKLRQIRREVQILAADMPDRGQPIVAKIDRGGNQLRQEAAKRGLDPNVWFHNVEYVAAEKIGAETVTYVGNIYKYFIAYHRIIEARAAREQAAEKLKGQRQ